MTLENVSNLELAEVVARFLMDYYGLEDWEFGFNNRKTAFGLCEYDKKRISLSKHYVEHRDPELTLMTIKHEIAHALVGSKHGHDAVWKSMFIKLGGHGKRCGDVGEGTKEPDPKWVLIRKDTMEVINKYFKKPRKNFENCWIHGKPETKGLLKLLPFEIG
jgi:hypothetical protein